MTISHEGWGRWSTPTGTDRIGFDALGRRSTIWQEGGVFVKADQYYSDQGPVAFFNEADNVTHFEHGDWLGTERMRTDNTGSAAVSSFSSLPFGEPNLTSGSDLNGAHFTGMDEDGLFSGSSLGLHHATFREYNSTLGRWMSPDSYSGSYDPTNPQSLNRYSYALNNPLSLTDPDGEDPSGGLCYLTASNCGAGGGGGGVGSGGYALGTYDLYLPTLAYTTTTASGQFTYAGDASSVMNGYNPGTTFGSDGTIYAGGAIQGTIVSYAMGNAPNLSAGSWNGGSGGGEGGTGSGGGGGGGAPSSGNVIRAETTKEKIDRCSTKAFGVSTIGAGAAVASGLNLLTTSGKFVGNTPGTSVASFTLSKVFPGAAGIGRKWAPTLMNPFAESAVAGRVLGRWVPIVGELVLAKQVSDFGDCALANTWWTTPLF